MPEILLGIPAGSGDALPRRAIHDGAGRIGRTVAPVGSCGEKGDGRHSSQHPSCCERQLLGSATRTRIAITDCHRRLTAENQTVGWFTLAAVGQKCFSDTRPGGRRFSNDRRVGNLGDETELLRAPACRVEREAIGRNQRTFNPIERGVAGLRCFRDAAVVDVIQMPTEREAEPVPEARANDRVADIA